MSTKETLTGAEALIRSLEMENVEIMFGLPGGCILPAYDPLLKSSIRHVLVRHEQGAGHMAQGYAHVTGRPGVAMVTSGPAATNMVTPLCDAFMDSIPMVCITGQVSTSAIGTDAFQECDTVGITRSVTKHNELVMRAEDIPMAVRQAFYIATTGRPGPVLIDMPKDVLQNTMTWHWPTDEEVVDSLPGYRPNVKGHPKMIKEAAKLILASEKPVLYLGGGVLKARAAEVVKELAESYCRSRWSPPSWLVVHSQIIIRCVTACQACTELQLQLPQCKRATCSLHWVLGSMTVSLAK